MKQDILENEHCKPSASPVVEDKNICECCGKKFSWYPTKDGNPNEPVVCSFHCYNKVINSVVDYEKENNNK